MEYKCLTKYGNFASLTYLNTLPPQPGNTQARSHTNIFFLPLAKFHLRRYGCLQSPPSGVHFFIYFFFFWKMGRCYVTSLLTYVDLIRYITWSNAEVCSVVTCFKSVRVVWRQRCALGSPPQVTNLLSLVIRSCALDINYRTRLIKDFEKVGLLF